MEKNKQDRKTGFKFVTKRGAEFTVARLDTTKYMEILKKHLQSTYSLIEPERLQKMEERLERFAKTSFAFVFNCAEVEFGLIYYFSPRKSETSKERLITIKMLERGKPTRMNLSYLFYNDEIVRRSTEQEKALLTAIEKNIAPGTALLLSSQKGGK
jgi:hypothetical protein